MASAPEWLEIDLCASWNMLSSCVQAFKEYRDIWEDVKGYYYANWHCKE